MNNYPFFQNIESNNIESIIKQINFLSQEITRLERRILNLEKNSITGLKDIKPTPLEYNNLNYPKENYII